MTFDEQLDAYLLIRELELPDSFRQALRMATDSEKTEMLRQRGIYSLPYSQQAIVAKNQRG